MSVFCVILSAHTFSKKTFAFEIQETILPTISAAADCSFIDHATEKQLQNCYLTFIIL